MHTDDVAPYPVASAEALADRSSLCALTGDYIKRTGPLNAADVRAYARLVRRVQVNLASLQLIGHQRYEALTDAYGAACQRADQLRDSNTLLLARAESWCPIPFMRHVPWLKLPLHAWDATVAAMFRAIVRGVRYLLGR